MRMILITASDFKDFDAIMRANGGFRPFKTDMQCLVIRVFSRKLCKQFSFLFYSPLLLLTTGIFINCSSLLGQIIFYRVCNIKNLFLPFALTNARLKCKKSGIVTDFSDLLYIYCICTYIRKLFC